MRALVVSGGGDKGAFAVGAIRYLMLRRGYRFDLVSGTSTGALIAPLVAVDDLEELTEIYSTVTRGKILRLNWRRLFRDAVYDTRPLERLVRRTMAGERYERLMAARTTVLLCAVSFQTGAVTYFTQTETPVGIPWEGFEGFVRGILASTNQPMLMPPVVINGQTYFDGGVKEVAPLQAAVRSGATEVVVIANSPSASLHPDPYLKMATIGPRAIDLFTEEILNNDLRNFAKSPAKVTVIRPLRLLPSSGLEFRPEVMKGMMREGYERAAEIVG